MTDKEEMALFWCGLLHPIIYGDMTKKQTRESLLELSSKTHKLPNGRYRTYSYKTLERKLKQYNEGKLESLKRKKRDDVGSTRASREHLFDYAVKLKKELPYRSVEIINEMLDYQLGSKIPKSTLYRHFKLVGATNLKLGISKEKVRKRWTRDFSNDLWLGDFEEGPYVMFEGETVQTHLSAFIDCHSRYIVSGRYYYRQNLDILIDSLIKGWDDCGVPNEIYLDNAKVYHSKAYKAACYELGIKPVYRKAGDPAPGGLIERFFLTVQKQFETEVRHQKICTLDELNEYFTAWLQTVYHKKVHSETEETPKYRFDKGLQVRRSIDLHKAIQYFWSKEIRTVNKTFSDVQVKSKLYKVPSEYRGDKVQVRYDSFGGMERLHIHSLNEEFLCEAFQHNREKGSDVIPFKSGLVETKPLEMFKSKHNQAQENKSLSIDFRKVNDAKRWSFMQFATYLADYIGREKEISSWSTTELEQLQKFWNRVPNLTPTMLSEAVSKVSHRDWLNIIQYILNHN